MDFNNQGWVAARDNEFAGEWQLRLNWAHEGAQTLNELYGKPEGVKVPAPVGSHAAALASLEQQYRHMGTPTFCVEEALTALLGSMAGYGTLDIECTTRASFDEALVSWPAPGSHPVKVAELLGEESKQLLTLDGASCRAYCRRGSCGQQ